jgi:hypothetical protein
MHLSNLRRYPPMIISQPSGIWFQGYVGNLSSEIFSGFAHNGSILMINEIYVEVVAPHQKFSFPNP